MTFTDLSFSTLVPVITFVLGWFGSRWTMSKKERNDVQQTLFVNGRELMDAQTAKCAAFEDAIKRYIDKSSPPALDAFVDIARNGEAYFAQQKIVSDAILSGRVDHRARDNTLVPSLRITTKTALPSYYRALQNIAKKNNFPFDGELKRENYESIYLVVEKYGKP